MKKTHIIISIFILIPLLLFSQQRNNSRVMSFIKDSLIIPTDSYIYYSENFKDEKALLTLDSCLALYRSDSVRILKEFTVTVNKFIINGVDSTITIEGYIKNIENSPRIPFKNVLIIVCNNKLRTMYYPVFKEIKNSFEIIEKRKYYCIKDYEMTYAHKIKNSSPPMQKFNCKFNLRGGKDLLIFCCSGYKTKVIDLTPYHHICPIDE